MYQCRIAPVPLTVAAVLLTSVTEALAQACVGVPSRGGEFVVQAGIGLTSGATSYGAGFTANLTGPLALGAGYELTNFRDVEPQGHTFSGNLAFEVPGMALSICPALEVGYSRVSGLSTNIYPGPYTTVTGVSSALSVSVGKTLSLSPALFVTPFAAAGAIFLHSVAQAESGGFSTPKYRDDEFGVGAVLGSLIGSAKVHVGVSALLTTLRDSDPVFTVGAGFVL